MQKQHEGDLIWSEISAASLLILLDEKSKNLTSKGFSDYLQKRMLGEEKKLFFA